jgi:predicted transcriptional regulator of viral defense system
MSDQSAEAKLYAIAESQAGYFSARQARQAGYSNALLSYHARRGKFLRVQPGVYRLRHFPEQPHADIFAAWLSAGPQAVVSHESALALYELTDLLPSEIHVTLPRTTSRRKRGIRLHTARLSPEEVTRRAGLPVTTLARTLADLLRLGVERRWIEQAIRQALERGLVSAAELRAYAQTHSRALANILETSLAESDST